MKLMHEEIKEMMPEYLRGALSKGIRDDIEAHLRECQGCKEELAFITDISDIDVPEPGDIFYKTLPQRIKAGAMACHIGRQELKASRFSLRFLLWPMPIAAAIAAILALVFTFTMINKGAPESDPFFSDPLEAVALDYQDITARDIPLITEWINSDESYTFAEGFMEHSYHREFASLSSKDLKGLSEVLKNKQERGG